jgi:hypothetical protein
MNRQAAEDAEFGKYAEMASAGSSLTGGNVDEVGWLMATSAIPPW